jgi:hypothetical protein
MKFFLFPWYFHGPIKKMFNQLTLRSDNKILTIGNHPTTQPPPTPSEFLMFEGKFPKRTMIGYPLAVLKDDNFALSA